MMSPYVGLGALNFFMADVHGGLGPFLATWLATAAQWDPARIGLVTTVGGIATLILYTPAGAMVDRLGKPRLLLGLSTAVVVVGAIALIPARSLWAVLAAQILSALGGALVAPSLVQLTLGVVGKKGFPRQQGRNEAFNHAGNVAAALLIAGLAGWTGPAAAFWVLGGMAATTGLVIVFFPRGSLDAERARGRKKSDKGEAFRRVFANRKLMLLAVALALFFLSEMSILPLLGQKIAEQGEQNATAWMAICVIIAQATMIPISWLAGRLADKYALRWLVVAACAIVPLRAALAAFAGDVYWLVPIQVLAGVAEGLVGVALPVLVADFTYGSGRTQTAIGGVSMVQGIGGAASYLVGGILAEWLGWEAAFLGMAAPCVVALVLALRLVAEAPAEADATRSKSERRLASVSS